MELTEEEKEQLRRWVREDKTHATALNDEWLKGFYTGAAMSYTVILRMVERNKTED